MVQSSCKVIKTQNLSCHYATFWYILYHDFCDNLYGKVTKNLFANMHQQNKLFDERKLFVQNAGVFAWYIDDVITWLAL